MPASCLDIITYANITTDGDYWIYPMAANGRRTKIFCHDMANEPSHFITLKNTNSFVEHDGSNWILSYRTCQSSLNHPLKRVEFTKVKIEIEVFNTLNFLTIFLSILSREYKFIIRLTISK